MQKYIGEIKVEAEITHSLTSMDKLIIRYIELTGITSPKIMSEDLNIPRETARTWLRRVRTNRFNHTGSISTGVQSQRCDQTQGGVIEPPKRCDQTPPPRARAHKESSSKIVKSKKDSFVQNHFDEFWQAYPRKVAKKTATKAFAKALKVAKPEQIIQAVHDKRGGLDSEAQYIPHAASWLNAERWDDPLPEANAKQPESEFAKYQKRLDANWGTAPVETEEMRQIKLEMGLA